MKNRAYFSNKARSSRWRNQQGITLVTTLLLLVLLMGMSLTMVLAVSSESLINGYYGRYRGSFYAAWLPIGGLSLVGLGIGASRKRRRWLIGAVLGFIAGLILLQPACGSASTSTTTNGGTLAGAYTVNLVGSAGTGASHNYAVTVQVN